jgi:hypothetical protein
LLAAVVITGIGICAAMAGIRTGLDTSHNTASMELSRHLADSLRQYSMGLAFSDPQGGATFGPEEAGIANFDDLDDLDDLVQSPPIDETGAALAAYSTWTLSVKVVNLDPDTLLVAADGTTSLLGITVDMEEGGRLVGTYQWLRADL